MRYLYACDQVDKKYYVAYWHLGGEDLGDYTSKHHPGTHHQLVHQIYLHKANSPLVLELVLTP